MNSRTVVVPDSVASEPAVIMSTCQLTSTGNRTIAKMLVKFKFSGAPQVFEFLDVALKPAEGKTFVKRGRHSRGDDLLSGLVLEADLHNGAVIKTSFRLESPGGRQDDVQCNFLSDTGISVRFLEFFAKRIGSAEILFAKLELKANEDGLRTTAALEYQTSGGNPIEVAHLEFQSENGRTANLAIEFHDNVYGVNAPVSATDAPTSATPNRSIEDVETASSSVLGSTGNMDSAQPKIDENASETGPDPTGATMEVPAKPAVNEASPASLGVAGTFGSNGDMDSAMPNADEFTSGIDRGASAATEPIEHNLIGEDAPMESPAAEEALPAVDAAAPAVDVAAPAVDVVAPAVDVAAPAVDAAAPALDAAAPAVDAAAPAVDAAAPAVDVAAPAVDVVAPAVDVVAPAVDSAAPAVDAAAPASLGVAATFGSNGNMDSALPNADESTYGIDRGVTAATEPIEHNLIGEDAPMESPAAEEALPAVDAAARAVDAAAPPVDVAPPTVDAASQAIHAAAPAIDAAPLAVDALPPTVHAAPPKASLKRKADPLGKPVAKRGAPNPLLVGFCELSKNWLAVACLEHARNLAGAGPIPEHATMMVRRSFDVDFSIHKKLVDDGDYRRLSQFFKNKLFEKEDGEFVIQADVNTENEENSRKVVRRRVSMAKRIQPLKKVEKEKVLPPLFLTSPAIPRLHEKKGLELTMTKMAELFSDDAGEIFPKVADPANCLTQDERVAFGIALGDGDERSRLPVATITVGSLDEVRSSDFHRVVTSSSLIVIRGMVESTGFDCEKFKPESILSKCPESEIAVMNQVPQPDNSNLSALNGKSHEWYNVSFPGRVDKEAFLDRYRRVEQYSKDAFSRLQRGDDYSHVASDMKAFLRKHNAPATVVRSSGWTDIKARGCYIAFGTNIDITRDEAFSDLWEELAKLLFLQPDGEDDLMRFATPIPGINHPQIYIKPPGSRTAAHMENSGLTSVNLNLGPGDCVWLTVPFDHSGNLVEMCKAKKVDIHTGHWPSEAELLAANIPVQRIIQKKNELVVVGPGTWHWVQANGFATNIAWNICLPTFSQLGVAALLHDDYRKKNKEMNVPIIYILWKIARQKLFKEDANMYVAIKSMLARSLNFIHMEEAFLNDRPCEVDAELACHYRCIGCNKSLFMFHVMVKGVEQCINCAASKLKKTDTWTIKRRCTTDELVQIYDEY